MYKNGILQGITEKEALFLGQKKKKENKPQNFVQGALILTLATALVKVFSAVFKIAIPPFFGNDALGNFSIAYSIYNILYVIAVAGIPTAISRMVAECVTQGRFRDIIKIRKISNRLLLVFGIVFTAIQFLVASPYAKSVKVEEATLSIIMLAPAIFFLCMMSSYRGYYNGLRNMVPTGASQVVEVIGKLLFGILLGVIVRNIGLAEYESSGTVFGNTVPSNIPADELRETLLQIMSPYTSAAVIFGVTISTAMGLLYLIWYSKKHGLGFPKESLQESQPARSGKVLFRHLFAIAVPICLGAIVSSISSSIDELTIASRLTEAVAKDSGIMMEKYSSILLSTESAVDLPKSLYNSYTLITGIFLLVPSFTTGFSTSALPSITSAWVSGDKKELHTNIDSVLKLTNLLAMPVMFLLIMIPEPILHFAYGTNRAIPVAASLLSLLGVSIVMVSIASPINAMLQGVGLITYPVIFMGIGAGLKYLSNYILIANPSVGINGAAIGTIVCYLFIVLAGLISLVKRTKVRIDVMQVFAKPMIAGMACGLSAWGSDLIFSSFLPGRIAFIFDGVICAIVYIIVLFLIGGISKNEINMLPKGRNIAKALEKRGILR